MRTPAEKEKNRLRNRNLSLLQNVSIYRVSRGTDYGECQKDGEVEEGFLV